VSDKPSVFNQGNKPEPPQQPAFDRKNLPPEVLQQLQQQGQGQTQQAELRDIHLPAEVSWFPPAIGWWIALALIIGTITLIYKAYKKQLARKAAMPINWRPALQDELSQIQAQFESSQDQQQLAIELSQLLRKTVINENPAQASQLAGLTGTAWLAALDQHFGYGTVFSQSATALTEAPYNPKVQFNADSLIKMVSDALHKEPKNA
jgi:hypothetical protein